MYKKARTRCGDPETTQTLNHRILYMEKIKAAVIQHEKRSCMGHQSGKTTTADVAPNQNVRPGTPRKTTDTGKDRDTTGITSTESDEKYTDSSRQQKDHLKEGESSLARADLDAAEQHFAAALKLVHVRDPTAQQYQREVEPLCKLGDVYSKRGQQTGDGGDFVKAVAIYNAAIARSNNDIINSNIITKAKEVEKSFLICVLDIHCNVSQDDTKKHKEQLKKMRDQVKLEMETIDQQLDPYVHDDDDPRVKDIEAKRAQTVRRLFEEIAQLRNDFISQLVEDCIGVMGPPPCKYALIGLGSQATGLVTPYSDLEFAILVEEESEECLVYFRNLTHYLHLKVVNLRETILPALGIKSLNDFYSGDPLDDWFYDSVTPRGFAFDGSMPKASKTPLGRKGTMNEPPSELICTPENMVSILQKDVTLYLKEGYHLATILRNPCMIAGDKDLIDTYMAITVKTLQDDGGKMAGQLALEILEENRKKYDNTGIHAKYDHTGITARLIDVKKEVYRFPALAVDCLALSSGIIPTTVWKTIQEMENQEVISANNAHHLTVLASISAELRLRTYIANGGQNENLSALASMETVLKEEELSRQTNDDMQTHPLKPVFHLTNEKQLFRYYQTALPLKSALSKLSGKRMISLNSFSDFYNNSPKIRGKMYTEVCRYRLAISYYEEALKKPEDTDSDTESRIDMLYFLGKACFMVGDNQKAISYSEQALQICRSIYGQDTADSQVAALLNNLATAWHYLGNHKKAIDYFQQALQMNVTISGQNTADPTIAASLTNLGSAWFAQGNHMKAISYYEQVLQMCRSIHDQNTEHYDLTTMCCTSLNNLGSAWSELGDYRRAISYFEQALQVARSTYGQSTAHPDIAHSLSNLGSVWSKLGDHRKAISYHELTLQMKMITYGHHTAHYEISNSLNSLGSAWLELGNCRRAISYFERALKMRVTIYGQSTAHPDIFNSLNNLGSAWSRLGDHRRAISCHEQALQMSRSIYGQSTAHSSITTSLNNLGTAWHYLGHHRKAISYFEQALEMLRSIHGQNMAHPHIADLLSNLGSAWDQLGDDRKAIDYFEKALQINNSIYDPSTAHPHIAISLIKLGSAWSKLGDHRKAISYFEKAIEKKGSMNNVSIYIAASLDNLGSAWSKLGDNGKAIRYHEGALKLNKRLWGQSKAHPNIATSLNNLGSVWLKMRGHGKAISYSELAMQMNRSIYGQSTAHADIVTSLNTLGSAWHYLGDDKKAISYLEQALQMVQSIYGQTTAHPDTITVLKNLGSVWHNMGDHRKAISYNKQALQMERSIYGSNTSSHPVSAISPGGSMAQAE
ncbi:tetratricopeptide repeat protein 28-like [Branchiostoma floridae]|uniref:Tetratricopeptide repeat protein 28-like n=1 Tax=Branchiostoma floridae TaxID=7739 RepID=A0A9J7MWA4_BRAFL|nr:tetratricopeptide repeat protein 28-like [Branchiostoma floridae]